MEKISFKNKIIQFGSLYYGAFISQGASLLIYFFATRILSLHAIGDFFILIALTEIISSALSMQSHMTILLEKKKELQVKNVTISLLILLISTVLLGVLFKFLKITGTSSTVSVIILNYLPLTVFLHGAFIVLEKYLIGQMKLNRISFAKALKVVVFGIVLLYFQFKGSQKNILILSYIAGQLILFLVLVLPVWSLIYHEVKSISISGIKSFVSKYKSILIFNTIISPINTLSNQLPYIFIPLVYGNDLVANYGILFKTILFPILLVSQINTQLFFKNVSKLHNRNKRIKIYLSSFLKRTLLIGLCLFILIVVFSNVFTNQIEYKWQLSISLLNVLVVWLIVNFVKTPISPLITILKAQKKWFFFEVIQLLLRGGTFLGCYYLQIKIISALGLYSMLSAVLGFILILIIYNEVLNYEKKRVRYNSISEISA